MEKLKKKNKKIRLNMELFSKSIWTMQREQLIKQKPWEVLKRKQKKNKETRERQKKKKANRE